jgi:hypothetical protein
MAPAMNAIVVRWTMTNLLDCPSANPGSNFNSGLPQGAKHEKVIERRRGRAGPGRAFMPIAAAVVLAASR